jgi:hypothetical protein
MTNLSDKPAFLDITESMQRLAYSVLRMTCDPGISRRSFELQVMSLSDTVMTKHTQQGDRSLLI